MIVKVVKVINPTSVRQLIRDYRLPITATAVFIAIVVFMVVGRLQARSVLGQILAVNNSGTKGYANLLSKDKSDLFTKSDVGDTGPAQSGENRPFSTNGSSSGTSDTATSGGTSAPIDGGSSSGTGGGTSTPTPGPAPVFGASVVDFRQDKAPELQCSSGPPNNPGNLLKCSKIYSFVASVQTLNGPGTVSYGWLYSVSGSNNGSYNASSGTSTSTLRNEITLSCRNPGNFTAQFVVNSPNSSKSQVMQISHNCTL